MKKQIISLGLVATLSGALAAASTTYEIKEGWQLLGADQNITDLSVFNNTCVDYLWKYDVNDTATDPTWKLHIANGVDYNYCGETMSSIEQGDGFWVKANGECNITIGTCDTLSDIPTPENIEDNCSTCETDTTSGTGGTVSHNGFTYGTVISPYTGKTWLDRNLGASQVCTSLNDTKCFGDYYQFGREKDGHEKYDSETTTTLATSIKNVGNRFILTSPDEWTTADSDKSLRSEYWSKIDGSSICPTGFRVPTLNEFKLETIDQGIDKIEKVFNTFLKIPSAYQRNRVNGTLPKHILWAGFWSTTISDNSSQGIFFGPNMSVAGGNTPMGQGQTIRCIKN
jgi:hypothetical protein